MDFDQVLLAELSHGEASVTDIADRLKGRIRQVLNRLVEAGAVEKSGFKGRGNEKLYRLPPPPPTEPIKRRV